jgi:hypothetical protein
VALSALYLSLTSVMVVLRFTAGFDITGHSRSALPARCLERTGGLTREGAGSFAQHIKSSIILASAIDAELRLPEAASNEHNYTLPWFSTIPCPRVADSGACTVDHSKLLATVSGICNGVIAGDSALHLLDIPQDCSTIYHHVNSERFEDLNDCISDWYRNALHIRRATKPKREVRVGIHLRWGDVAASRNLSMATKIDYRSPSINQINTAYSQITFVECDVVRIFLYIEKHPHVIPGTFLFRDFEIIDSGDPIADLQHYASNDILIQGKSSWAVFGAFGAERNTIVITDPDYVKYKQRHRHVLHTYRYGDRVMYKCR